MTTQAEIHVLTEGYVRQGDELRVSQQRWGSGVTEPP